MLERIVSGFQTGSDQAGTMTAYSLGIPTGGWIAQGWMTEDGPAEWAAEYGLKPCPQPGYTARTEANVRDSHATLIITRELTLTGGSYSTMCIAESLDRPLCIVRLSKSGKPLPAPPLFTTLDGYHAPGYTASYPSKSTISFKSWLEIHSIRTLNIAGPRESKSPGIFEAASEVLMELLGGLP